MGEPLSAFILSAGFGERLRPITQNIPKPLLPIIGKPVLGRVLEKLTRLPFIAGGRAPNIAGGRAPNIAGGRAPIARIGINTHHLSEAVEGWLGGSAFRDRVTVFREGAVLGTGGALKNAERFLSGGPFIVHNGDVFSEIDLGKLIAAHLASDIVGAPCPIATLAVHDYPKFNNLIVNADGLLCDVRKASGGLRAPTAGTACHEKGLRAPTILAFTGIAVYSPEFLKFLPSGPSSVVDAWLSAIKAGKRVGTYDVSGSYWADIGTPESYAETIIHTLKADGETVYIHPSVEGCHTVEIEGPLVVEENSRLNGGIFGKCIVLPACSPPPGRYENCIIGPDFTIPIPEAEGPVVIGAGGSDRSYYREKKNGRSVVVLDYSVNEDSGRYIAYYEFFRKHSIPVPELLTHDNHKLVFEDLGDISLYSRLKCRRPLEEVEAMYKRVIDMAVMLHTEVTAHMEECPQIKERVFDYDHLRWETAYFIERFVIGVVGLKVDMKGVTDAFHRLALKVDALPKTVIHRDLQSQNIMIGVSDPSHFKDGAPRLIDYQGARLGPPAYDIASLLWDPYYRLDDALRERLIGYYGEKTGWDINEKGIRDARLQRHMQALGAYGFLSTVKGKKYFLKHVPEGLRLLKEDAELCAEEYPAIYELASRLQPPPLGA